MSGGPSDRLMDSPIRGPRHFKTQRAGAVPREARAVSGVWRQLHRDRPEPLRFTPAMLIDLPEPARRWLTHAVDPGTPLWSSVELTMHGQIRLGSWRSFTAAQVIAPSLGYIWCATARVCGLPVRGFDRLSGGTGEMRWRLLGVLPVMSSSGPDVTRSAEGRLAAEGILLPTAFQGAAWSAGSSPDHVVATWAASAGPQEVELHIGPSGQLLSALLQRWGSPPGAPFGRYPFGVTVVSERTFAGITLPDTLLAAWWWGTDKQGEGEFFRARISAARFA